MPIWKWKEKFADERICRVEAETLDEAWEKRNAGNLLSKETVDFYSEEILSDMEIDDS